jgi:hypothetical protein
LNLHRDQTKEHEEIARQTEEYLKKGRTIETLHGPCKSVKEVVLNKKNLNKTISWG